MNKFDRVLTTMNHKEPDRVPVYPILSGISRKLVGATYKEWSTNSDICAQALIKTADEFDIDCIVTLIDLSVECDAWGQELIYPENEAAHPDYSKNIIKDIEDYAKIKKVDYRNSKRMMMHIDVCKKVVEAKGKELPIIAFVFGPLGILSMLRGQQEMYMDLYDDIDAVQSAAKEITETLKEYVGAVCDTGVNAVMFDTLYASGSIMSKEMWKSTEGVLMPELAEIVRQKNCLNMIHNCGNNIYFDVQIEAIQPSAISFLHPPDDCKDYAECKEKYGKDITLIGCVTPANAVIGSDEEWDQQCKDFIDVMSKDGGFVLATGCEYPANASFDRANRMIEIAKTYGRYKK